MKPLLPVALVLSWLVATGPSWRWLAGRWLDADGTLHLLLAAVVSALVVRQVDPGSVWPARGSARPAVLAWIIAPLVAATALYRVVPADTALAMGAVASAYGIAGLFVSPATWRGQRALALLAVAALPLTGPLDVLLGFPLRQGTASVVAAVLGAELDAATVLVVEGGAAHVDIPCAGVQSLWSGGVVLALAAAVWRRPLGMEAGLAGLVTVALLLVGNTGRVLALVVAHHLAGLPLLAEVLHVPLGVLVFVGSLAPGLWILRRCREVPAGGSPASPSSHVAWIAAVALLVLPLVQVAPPREPVARSVQPVGLELVAASPAETAFAEEQGAQLSKVRLAGPLPGTAVFVASRNWMAHHVPEQCHEAGGWTLADESITKVGDTPVRWASATRGGSEGTVIWWFQRAGHRTPDHTERIARGLWSDEPWVLVSVLITRPTSPEDPALETLIEDLAEAAERGLETT